MKYLLLQFIILPGLFFTSSAKSLSDISQALGAGDVDKLTTYLDSEVELSLLGEDDFFTKAEAADQLQSFFVQYTASKFTQIHTGTSETTKAEYCIGNLIAGGKTFRVVIYLTQSTNGLKIKKMSFDPE